MFRVKNMTVDDYAFGVQVTDEMRWGLSRADFEFMMELEPKGCFVLFDGLERVGIATTVSFGRTGWFGNLIVRENYRERGAGSLLVEHSVKYLKKRNVETVGLYAYVDRVPFYERLGFRHELEFAVLKGKGFSSAVRTDLRRVGEQDIQEVVDYDCICFGSNRRRLLDPIIKDSDNICYMSVEDGQISGYSVAKVYRKMAELGPLICRGERSDVAIDLLKTTLNSLEGLEVSMCVPRKESAILRMLMASGFKENFRVTRMFLGSHVAEDCIYIAESLERG